MLVAYIDQHRGRFGVEPICRVPRLAGMQIAPSSYYAAKTRPPSARAVADEQRLAVIRKVHQENYGVYGVRTMHAELNRRGHTIARCTVHRLMRAEGLRGITRAKGPRTTIAGSGPDTRPDLLDRDFAPPLRRTGSGSPTSTTAAPSPAGSTPRSSSTSTPVASWGGRCRRVCVPTWHLMPSRWVLGPRARGPRHHRRHRALGYGSPVPRGALHPAAGRDPGRWHRWGRQATPMTMLWPRRSIRCSRPSWSAARAPGRASTTSRSLSLSTSTSSTTDACTARSDSSHPSSTKTITTGTTPPRYRRRVSSEPLLNLARGRNGVGLRLPTYRATNPRPALAQVRWCLSEPPVGIEPTTYSFRVGLPSLSAKPVAPAPPQAAGDAPTATVTSRRGRGLSDDQ